MTKKNTQSLQELKRLTHKWKNKLGLADWKIKVIRGRVPRGDLEAYSEADADNKTATIWVHNESDIVHELLHILLYDIEYDAYEEKLVSRIENILVSLSKDLTT